MTTIQDLFDQPVEVLELETPVVTARPSDSIDQVLRQLRGTESDMVCVTSEEGQLLGLFTEHDYIKRVAGNGYNEATETVERHMTENPFTVSNNDPIVSVILRMHMGKFRHMIIVDFENRVENIITVKDVAHYLLNAYRENRVSP